MSIPNYEFDRSGQAGSNLIAGELHDLTNNVLNVVLLAEGSYYADSLVINSVVLGRALVRGEDYKVMATDLEISAYTGKEVAVGINILDKNLSGDITITYQAVGGYEGKSPSVVRKLIEAIDNAESANVDWANVNAPDTFPPEEHNHGIETLTELEILSNAFRDLTNAIKETYSLDLSGVALRSKTDRIQALLSEMRNDLNRVATGGGIGEDATEAEIQAVMDNFEALSALVVDQSTRQLEFEENIADIDDRLTAFQTTINSAIAELQTHHN